MADQPVITITVPKPLPCRLMALLQDWKLTRDNMKKRGEDEAVMAVEVCAEMLHGEVTEFLKEHREWYALTPEQRAKATADLKASQRGLEG